MVKRDGGKVAVLQEKISEVKQILEDIPKFIDRPEQHEYFQRKYGLDPKHKKDNRNIVQVTGIDGKTVENVLVETYPNGSVGAFMTKYFEMAFKGRDEATEFEKATVELFQDVFGYEAKHVGPIGLTPDVLLLSDSDGYQAILDNKAYHKYTISNDHYNRMVHNYIENLSNYSDSPDRLAFFSYIAGGFGKNINKQIQSVADAT